MITVTETVIKENHEPVLKRRSYSFSKKEFIQILKKSYGISNKVADEIKKTNSGEFSYAGIKRKIEIKEDEIEVGNSSQDSL